MVTKNRRNINERGRSRTRYEPALRRNEDTVMNQNVALEAIGWSLGLVGFLMAMYGVYLTTSGQSMVVMLGTLALSLVVAVVGVSIAITGRERRKPGSLASRMRKKNEDDPDPVRPDR